MDSQGICPTIEFVSYIAQKYSIDYTYQLVNKCQYWLIYFHILTHVQIFYIHYAFY